MASFTNPEHLLVLAQIPVAAKGLLDESSRSHTEGSARVGLLVHALCDTSDIFGCWVDGE
jgi:hypothetical protein